MSKTPKGVYLLMCAVVRDSEMLLYLCNVKKVWGGERQTKGGAKARTTECLKMATY